MSKKTSAKKYYKLPAELLGFGLSPRAVIVYCVLADRAELSKGKEAFTDAQGNYIIYKREDICSLLGIGKRTADYALAELEDAGLLIRRQQGRNLPVKLYIQTPGNAKNCAADNAKNCAPGNAKNCAADNAKNCAHNYTDINYTDIATLPMLMQMIAEVAAESGQTLTPKQGLKLAKKVIAAKPRSPRAWIRTVLPSAAKDIDTYDETYDLSEYAASSVLDEWDE